MNLIDNNCIELLFKTGITLNDEYYFDPEIAEELTLTVEGKNKSSPESLLPISTSHYFNELIYIDYYKSMLNKHYGRGYSFYNMTGFGDISILATTYMLLSKISEKQQKELFSESITIFTEDGPLTRKINKEFAGKQVNCKGFESLI